jgi:DNA processing protein
VIGGAPESEVAALVRAVSPRDVVSPLDLDRDGIAERFARARWSGLTEPGDGDAGRLIAAVGAVDALELLEAAVSGDAASPLDDRAGGQHTDAVERWRPRLRQINSLLHLRQAARFGARLVIPGDPEWPTGLDDLGAHTPMALWVRGVPGVLGTLDRSLAIVGARAATGYGEHVTIEVASGLVDRGFAIVSGAAFGIDGAAHRAALASRGTTVAFLAGGVDRFYPSAHESLLGRIVEYGAVVSEVPCGTAPTKWRFLQRKVKP